MACELLGVRLDRTMSATPTPASNSNAILYCRLRARLIQAVSAFTSCSSDSNPALVKISNALYE